MFPLLRVRIRSSLKKELHMGGLARAVARLDAVMTVDRAGAVRDATS